MYSSRDWPTMSGATIMPRAASTPKNSSMVTMAAMPSVNLWLRSQLATGASTVHTISASTAGNTPTQKAPMSLPIAKKNSAMTSSRSVNFAPEETQALNTTMRSTRSSRLSAV